MSGWFGPVACGTLSVIRVNWSPSNYLSLRKTLENQPKTGSSNDPDTRCAATQVMSNDVSHPILMHQAIMSFYLEIKYLLTLVLVFLCQTMHMQDLIPKMPYLPILYSHMLFRQFSRT